MIFVFGSNLAGRHGKGAALYARQHHGAIYGQGIGIQGSSYGIPTKDEHLKILPLETIEIHIRNFVTYANENPDKTFMLTPIDTGLAEYKKTEIFNIIRNLPIRKNILFTKEWFNL